MATQRMSSEERREQLLGAGLELLGRCRYDEVSIGEMAAAAGVAKGLLYHHFPSKDELIVAVLEREQRELAERLAPDPSLAASERLEAGIEGFLDYVEGRPTALAVLSPGGNDSSEISAALKAGRTEQLARLVEALGNREPAIEDGAVLETALQGWLCFCEGAALHHSKLGEPTREELRVLLRTALDGSLLAAALAEAMPRVDSR
jgi:AcrR family transcriptional regulator